jgi:hypothetical protein
VTAVKVSDVRICSLYACKPDLYSWAHPYVPQVKSVDEETKDARAGGIKGEIIW